jgi:DNA-binding response OmpR family regulator
MKDILIVHDRQESNQLRKSYLEMSGFAVEVTYDAANLVERLEKKMPALVLMDVLLEGPNGFELCREIRKRWGPDELIVLLTSGIYRSRIYRDEATAAGAQGYILKPCEPDELVREVSLALARKETASTRG